MARALRRIARLKHVNTYNKRMRINCMNSEQNESRLFERKSAAVEVMS